jgi:hypothetical protein
MSETNYHTRVRFMSPERTNLSFLHSRLTRMRQLVTFAELSNDVDTIGTG